jgi:hypothetical protein
MTKARDAAWVQAWQVYEEKKRAWAAGGCNPAKQPRFFWHPRQGATFKIPSGRITARVKIHLPPHQPPTLSRIGPRRARRSAAASSDRGEDGGDPDPDPDPDPDRRKTPSVDETGGVQRLIHNPGTKTEGRVGFVARIVVLHKPVASPVNRVGARCPR